MIIADTGFFLALFNANDRLHSNAVQALNKLSEPLITTHPVIVRPVIFLFLEGVEFGKNVSS